MNRIPFIPKGVRKVNYVRGIGSTPARIHRRTGELQINLDRFPFLHPAHQHFVLWHEEGHKVLDTSNEKAVDAYASDKYFKAGLPLSESVKALTRVLNPDIPQHRERAALQLQRALEYDRFVNQNPIVPPLTHRPMQHLSATQNLIGFGSVEPFDELFGIAIGKKAKQRKQEKHEVKMAKKQAKVNVKNARAEAIRTKADAKLALAQVGVAQPSVAGEIAMGLGQVGAGVAAIATGQGGAPPAIATPPPQPPAVADMTPAVPLNTMQQAFQNPAQMDTETSMPRNRRQIQRDPGKAKAGQINMTAIIVGVVVVAVLAFAFMRKS